MRSLCLEIMESGGIGGGGTAGSMEISARVGFTRVLLVRSGEGVGLGFAIAGGCRASFSVAFFVFSSNAAFLRLSFLLASSTAASWARVVISWVEYGWELPCGSGGRLGPRSSPLNSGFSATILVISRLGACWYRLRVGGVP